MPSTATPARIVAAALADLRKPGPIDTCVINGMQRFAREAGAPMLLRHDGNPTASITEARALAREGRQGWTYHEGLAGVQPGDFVDWRLPVGIFHVSTVIAVRSAGGHVTALRTIGSGGPTGLINWQPAAGDPAGWNAAAYWQGYWRAPLAGKSRHVVKKPPAPHPQPKPTGRRFTTARPNEGMLRIAARVDVPFEKLAAWNPQVKAPAYVVQVGQKVWTEGKKK